VSDYSFFGTGGATVCARVTATHKEIPVRTGLQGCFHGQKKHTIRRAICAFILFWYNCVNFIRKMIIQYLLLNTRGFVFLNVYSIDKILSSLYNDRIMGQIPQPETKRDEALIRDYLLKEDEVWAYSLTQLGVRYAREVDGVTIPLTSSRISQILERHKVPRKRVSR